MVGNELTDNFVKDKFPEADAPAPERVINIYEFDSLIDDYQSAQRPGADLQDGVAARRALKDAYRAALRAAGKSDR